jgi:hypothetical protein
VITALLKDTRNCSDDSVHSWRGLMTQVEKSGDTADVDQVDVASANEDTKLLEGLDYYLEKGLFVFTAAFLRKRGYCCESGCRHCPYQNQKP